MIKDIYRILKNRNLHFALVFVASVVLYSCANMASPSGGDYDFDPPKVLKTTPVFNATNVNSNVIEIVFDELVQIEKPNENVIVTPPQKRMPVIRAVSNRVKVELRDTLLPNTTYTIDFTSAIVDNNEKNPLENFSISFSTGDIVDSLAVSGKVLAANNLEPVKGIYVGLHSNLDDSAFIKIPFERISRTNENGEFTIRGVAPGKYRIYALDDVVRSYKYDNQSNAIAFLDTIIVPSFTSASRIDTLFNKDMTIDTVVNVGYTRFLPDDIVLRSFTSSFRRQYLQKHERPSDSQMNLFFGASTQLAEIKPLSVNRDIKDWAVLERSAGNDTLQYWIIDPQIAEMDTLKLQVTYHKTDTLNNPVLTTDTLNFIDRNKKNREKALEKAEKDKKKKDAQPEFLGVSTNVGAVLNMYDSISIVFAQPLQDFDKDKLQLQSLVDSVYQDEEFQIISNERNPRKYVIIHKWQYGKSYRLSADSAVFNSYYGLHTNTIDQKFRIKREDEYGKLYLQLSGYDFESSPAFIELLDGSDKPLRKSLVKHNKRNNIWGALFSDVNPGKYYFRIVIDKNDNGIWDTGDYYKKIEPEEVYYCNKAYEIKALWEQKEEWNITELPLGQQKPLEVTKNKPKEKESRRKQLEQEEKKQNERNRNSQQQNQVSSRSVTGGTSFQTN